MTPPWQPFGPPLGSLIVASAPVGAPRRWKSPLVLSTNEGLPPLPRRGLSRRSRVALILLPALAASAAAAVVLALAGGAGGSGATSGAGGLGSDTALVRLDEAGVRSGAAPAIDLPGLRDGEARVSLADLRGTPVVVNFFSSTCVPCRTELPLLQHSASRLAGRVAFVGVDHLDPTDAGRRLVAATGVRFPVGSDPEGGTALRYEVPALPATFFIDADGRIAGRVLGVLTPTALDAQLAALEADAPATGAPSSPPSPSTRP